MLRAAGQFKMGPFELMDLIGNDVNAAVTRQVWTAFNFDPRFTPSRIQDELVAAGRYGRKTAHRLLRLLGIGRPTGPCRPRAGGRDPGSLELHGSCAQLDTFVDDRASRSCGENVRTITGRAAGRDCRAGHAGRDGAGGGSRLRQPGSPCSTAAWTLAPWLGSPSPLPTSRRPPQRLDFSARPASWLARSMMSQGSSWREPCP